MLPVLLGSMEGGADEGATTGGGKTVDWTAVGTDDGNEGVDTCRDGDGEDGGEGGGIGVEGGGDIPSS